MLQSRDNRADLVRCGVRGPTLVSLLLGTWRDAVDVVAGHPEGRSRAGTVIPPQLEVLWADGAQLSPLGTFPWPEKNHLSSGGLLFPGHPKTASVQGRKGPAPLCQQEHLCRAPRPHASRGCPRPLQWGSTARPAPGPAFSPGADPESTPINSRTPACPSLLPGTQ